MTEVRAVEPRHHKAVSVANLGLRLRIVGDGHTQVRSARGGADEPGAQPAHRPGLRAARASWSTARSARPSWPPASSGHSYALVADACESFADVMGSCVTFYRAEEGRRSRPTGTSRRARSRGDAGLRGHGAGAGRRRRVDFLARRAVARRAAQRAESAARCSCSSRSSSSRNGCFTGCARAEKKSAAWPWWPTRGTSAATSVTSVAALIGIIVAWIGGPAWSHADSWAAMVASIWLAGTGLWLLGPTLHELMEGSVDPALLEFIRETSQDCPGIKGIDKVWVRKLGMRLMVDLHIEVDPDISVQEGHRLAHEVKDKLQTRTAAGARRHGACRALRSGTARSGPTASNGRDAMSAFPPDYVRAHLLALGCDLARVEESFIHSGGARRPEREQGGDVRAVALRAAEYFAQDAGAPHAGGEPARGVEIIGGAIAAAARPAGGGAAGRAGIEAAPKRAASARRSRSSSWS